MVTHPENDHAFARRRAADRALARSPLIALECGDLDRRRRAAICLGCEVLEVGGTPVYMVVVSCTVIFLFFVRDTHRARTGGLRRPAL